MRLRWTVAAGLLGLGIAVGACSPPTHRPSFHRYEDDLPGFSAARLGEPLEDESVADLLAPDERSAVRRAGLPVRDEARSQEEEDALHPKETKLDQAGHGAIAALGVGVSVFMMVAPYLLF